MKVSICIPTYNRARYLNNCLNSIVLNHAPHDVEYEVCVSDNCSTDTTASIVMKYSGLLPLKYSMNSENIGIPGNFLNVVKMAKGDFVWLLGDDDLLLPNALESLSRLFSENSCVDFFYINSFHFTTEAVMAFPQPFDTVNLPISMTPFSSWPISSKCSFLDLINPKVSFDFLGGMFLSVFRRELWERNTSALDYSALVDKRTFSHFDNTFPHIKIFSRAFSGKNAYFSAIPLSVCLTGAREWAPMYPFICSIRLPEALKEYRKNGLTYKRYLLCKNYALRQFASDLGYMVINRKVSGIQYINIYRHIIANCLYPNLYLSIVYYLVRKIRGFFR